jgi:hypothetical protein
MQTIEISQQTLEASERDLARKLRQQSACPPDGHRPRSFPGTLFVRIALVFGPFKTGECT